MAEAGEYAVRPPRADDVTALAEVLGDAAAYLWVARGNERAIRFYRRHDFAEDGTESTDQHDGITEIRMVRG